MSFRVYDEYQLGRRLRYSVLLALLVGSLAGYGLALNNDDLAPVSPATAQTQVPTATASADAWCQPAATAGPRLDCRLNLHP